jgi:hypothetical protein
VALAAAATLAGFVAAPVVRAQSPSPPATIGDLTKHRVQVQKDTPASASATKAMENYRRFLELQNTDPKLRAEAMRASGTSTSMRASLSACNKRSRRSS